MKTLFKTLLSLLLFLNFAIQGFDGIFSASAQAHEAPPVFDWQECVGTSSPDAASKIIRTTDGGYLLTGTTANDALVSKLDNTGSMVWEHVLGGSSYDALMSAVQLPSGKIFAAGYSSSSSIPSYHGSTDVWIVSLDVDGKVLWEKDFGGSNADAAQVIIKTSDGNLLVGGSTSSFNGDVTSSVGSDDYWLMKIDTSGNLIWQQSYGGTGTDICYGITEDFSGNYLAVGSSNSPHIEANTAANDIWAVQVNANGLMQWQKSFGGSKNESAFDVITNTDGNYVIAGYTNSIDGDIADNNGGNDFWMLMLDQAGTILNNKTYGGSNSDVAYSIVQAGDGGYLLAGSTYSNLNSKPNQGQEDFCVIKIDPIGNLKWSRTYGGSSNDRAVSVLSLDDGGFIASGYSFSNDKQVTGNHGSADIWINKQSCLNPQSSFKASSDTTCVNSIVGLVNTSANVAEYSWIENGIIFDNNTDASLQLNTAGKFNVSLIGATCYSVDTSEVNLVAISYPTPSISASQSYLCPGKTLVLTTDAADSYLWSNGETTSSALANAPGDYTVTVANHNCAATSPAITIADKSIPVFSLGTDTSLCQGAAYIINAPAGFQSYVWQNGYVSNSYTAGVAGTYSVTVDNGYCSVTSNPLVLTMKNCGYPVANFSTSQTSICQNSCLSFKDLSTDALSWNWSFPGATKTTSTEQNPTGICYTTPGTYDVILNVNNNSGATSMIRTGYIVVNAAPDKPTITPYGYWLVSSSAITYQWFHNGMLINDATNQDYTATEDGYYYVLAGNDQGCFSQSDPVYINSTGINNVAASSTIKIYPNPASETITITDSKTSHWESIKIIDATGKTVSVITEPSMLSSGTASLNISALERGIYLLQVASANGENSRYKFIVNR